MAAVRDRSRLAVRWGAYVAAWCIVACAFDDSGAGTGASLSVGDDGPGPGSVGDDVGSEDDGSEGGSQDGDAGSTGLAPAECEAPNECGASAPDGWSGPFVLASTSPPDPTLVCPGDWQPQFWAYRDLHDVPATCGCDCTPSQGTCDLAVGYYSDASCVSVTEGAAVAGDCVAMGTANSHGYVQATPTATGVNCAPAPTKNVPPIAWGEGSLFCSPPPTAPCEDGPCLPPTPGGFAARWCVTADGDRPCPAGEYEVPFLLYRSAADMRDCSACTCTLSGTPSCPGALEVFSDVFCAFSAGTVAIDGACHAAPISDDSLWGVEYDGGAPSYACTPSGSAPMGAVTPNEPLTVCCTP